MCLSEKPKVGSVPASFVFFFPLFCIPCIWGRSLLTRVRISRSINSSLSLETVSDKPSLHVYLWLIHVDVWQKPTQHYKAIILQLNF